MGMPAVQGNDLLTVTATGLVARDDVKYICMFSGKNYSNASDPIAAKTATTIECRTPVWPGGAENTLFQLLKSGTPDQLLSTVIKPGDPLLSFAFEGGWSGATPTTVGASGGSTITVTGYGFSMNFHSYRCKFNVGTDVL